MTSAVGMLGGTTVRMPSPRSSDLISAVPRSIMWVMSNSASLMMRRSLSVRDGEPNATTSVNTMVQFSPFSGRSPSSQGVDPSQVLAGAGILSSATTPIALGLFWSRYSVSQS